MAHAGGRGHTNDDWDGIERRNGGDRRQKVEGATAWWQWTAGVLAGVLVLGAAAWGSYMMGRDSATVVQIAELERSINAAITDLRKHDAEDERHFGILDKSGETMVLQFTTMQREFDRHERWIEKLDALIRRRP